MSGHVPPPGADRAVEAAALAYLVAVQTAIGTTHTESVFRIAMVGVVKQALRFGLSALAVFGAVRDVERRMF